MAHSLYRGESIGKEAARAQAYAGLKRWNMLNGKHVVIAGHGGDIQFLLRQGVNPSNIIACDKKEECRRIARNFGCLVPKKEISRDIVSTVKWANQERFNLASINIDLFSTLIRGIPILNSVINLMDDCLWGRPQIYYTFLSGRDRGLGKEDNEPLPGYSRKAYFKRCTGFSMKEYYSYKSWTPSSEGSPMCTAYLRDVRRRHVGWQSSNYK